MLTVPTLNAAAVAEVFERREPIRSAALGTRSVFPRQFFRVDAGDSRENVVPSASRRPFHFGNVKAFVSWFVHVTIRLVELV